MTKHDKIVKEIKETTKEAQKLDIRVVDKICRSPFLFTANVFRDPNDTRPIMLRYLGKFVLRGTREKLAHGKIV